MNIVMLLEMAAESFPDRVAVCADGESLTYDGLLRAAWAAAENFRRSGCAYVALLDINSIAVPVTIFGAAFAGIPYVPLNYRLTHSELNDLLLRIEPAYLISESEYVAALHLPERVSFIGRDEFLDGVFFSAPDCTPPQAADADIAIQLFTSGTTGKPKAALLRHDHLLSYILGTVEYGAADPDDAALIAVPPYHIAGISAVLSSTYACRRMVQLPNFDAAEWLRLCEHEKISNAFVVPTMLTRIVDYWNRHGAVVRLPALRAIAYGGGKMPLSVIERAIDGFPEIDFTNAYGLTETSSTICLLGPEDHRLAMASTDPRVRKRLASVGRAHGGIELQIRGDNGVALGADEVGEVYVRGGQVSGEYLGIGSLLDAEGWFPTRDRGYLDAEGYLFLEGRADDVVVRGGENISPGEIEDVLLEHPAVIDAAVVAMPSEQWGETVAAAIVLADGCAATGVELQQWARERLRSSRVPEAIIFKDSLPYNEMGKILRRLVKQEFAQGVATLNVATGAAGP